jgi:uncharacterized protein with PIN domain
VAGGGGRRFFVDAMLGRLATWLRILGMDVLYERAIEDDVLIERAVTEDRLVLTRDRLLARRRLLRGRVFLARSDHVEDQVREVVGTFGVEREKFFTRCVRCNVPLRPLPAKAAEGRVPPYVFRTEKHFFTCTACGRVYWPGTHRAQMEKKIREMLGDKARER